MRLSISNSSDRAPGAQWLTIWLFVILVTFIVITVNEFSWRERGFRPSVTDSPDLWSYLRGRVYPSNNSETVVVLLGDSRMQLDFSHSVFEDFFPNKRLINLSIVGKCPLATLRDLASDQDFDGIVLVDTNALCLRKEYRDDQRSYVDHYHHSWSYNRMLNRHIATFVQEHFVSVLPDLNLISLLKGFVWNKSLPGPNYIVTHSNRSAEANYKLFQNLQQKRKNGINEIKSQAAKRRKLSPDKWLAEAIVTKAWGQRIEARGGKVVFIRFPTADERWDFDQQQYPRSEYWDKFASAVGMETLHFKDIPGGDAFKLPDASHLDYRDAPVFTELLLRVLIEKNYFE